jgi:site-specific DNA recombinase
MSENTPDAVVYTHQSSDKDTPKRFIIYARTAIRQESGIGYSISAQIEACKQYALAKGYEPADLLVYQETASGGDDSTYEMLHEIFEAAKQGKFEILVVNTYDRISRSPEVLVAFVAQFRELGVTVESVSDPLEDSPEGRFMLEVRLAVASLERSYFIARMQYGKRVKKAKKETPFGYKEEGSGLEVDGEQASTIREVFGPYFKYHSAYQEEEE